MFVNFYTTSSKNINRTGNVQSNPQVATVPAGKKRRSLGESIGAPASTKEQEIVRINSLSSDREKIIEYNKKNANSNYIIIDKSECSATVYDQNGKVLKKFEVGLGMDIGDKKPAATTAESLQKSENIQLPANTRSASNPVLLTKNTAQIFSFWRATVLQKIP